MRGISLNKPIQYCGASFRFFAPREHHISRVFGYDVLILVFEGTLRFSEGGHEVEVGSGEYYIQKKGVAQRGERESDSPKYLYVHFDGTWVDSGGLEYRGTFNTGDMYPYMAELDRASHAGDNYISQAAEFYKILKLLKQEQSRNEVVTTARLIAGYIGDNYLTGVTLDGISKHFHFSKNHIINTFKKEYKMTPLAYANLLRITKAESLLEITAEDIETVAFMVGFSNYSHFYKLFYRKNKMSPRAWRQTRRFEI